ncbi:hypothetical protein F5Y16DRAFT_405835 [Xylariaceae sp. FL0255]|nr:hypothetical protein F5Y16DRAFT_405835 [Xylariaceae sp. FL0255]
MSNVSHDQTKGSSKKGGKQVNSGNYPQYSQLRPPSPPKTHNTRSQSKRDEKNKDRTTSRKATANFTRAEWDEIFGSFAVVTDVSWKYAPSLIAAYPETRIILTERNVDSWQHSGSETIIDRLCPQGI